MEATATEAGPREADVTNVWNRATVNVQEETYGKFSCHNCVEYPHGPLPKRCDFSKEEDHLIAECPNRKTGQRDRLNKACV